jgi:hypothetical protein
MCPYSNASCNYCFPHILNLNFNMEYSISVSVNLTKENTLKLHPCSVRAFNRELGQNHLQRIYRSLLYRLSGLGTNSDVESSHLRIFYEQVTNY